MGGPSRVRVSGPLEFSADGFRTRLSDLGYTSIGAVGQLRLMAHVSRWLASQRLTAGDLDVVRVEQFLAARRAEGYVQWCSPKAMVVLLEYLHELGVVPVPVHEPPTGVEALLTRYRDYLLIERGLAVTTARGYVDMVRPFVEARAATCGGVPDFAGLSAAGCVAVRIVRVRGPQPRVSEVAGHRAALITEFLARHRCDHSFAGRGGAFGRLLAAGRPAPGVGGRAGASAVGFL